MYDCLIHFTRQFQLSSSLKIRNDRRSSIKVLSVQLTVETFPRRLAKFYL